MLAAPHAVAPLKVHRAFPTDDGEALVQLVHVGPGLFAGDTLDLTLTVGPRAKAIVVPQSATKVHTMPAGGRAVQTIRIHVAGGARCEVHGGLVIPFPAAHLVQKVEVDLEPDATFLWTERWSTGRSAEAHDVSFHRLDAHLSIRVGGTLAYADRVLLAPDLVDPQSEGLLEGHRAWASGVAVNVPVSLDHLTGLGADDRCAIVPLDERFGGVAFRSLHDDPGDARDLVYAFANEMRRLGGACRVDYARFGS